MVEYLLLFLLPPAVYFGWWLAKTVERRSIKKRSRLFSNQYFQGLNYLLNEQPDKAIQVFLELAEVNQDTVETHMALGSLFRQRGEVDRAIRFHQNIIAKPGLESSQRTQALLELGEDYMRAGLLDRAERLFSELIESDAQTPSALRSLLEIYQQEKDWENALEQARRLEQLSGEQMAEVMAQFCCEMAETAVADGDKELARRHLRQARRHHLHCIRARFILARLATCDGDHEGAMDTYEEIAELDADHIPEILEPYLNAAARVGQAQRGRKKLEDWVQAYTGISLILKLTQLIEEEKGGHEAGKYLIEAMASNPSVRGLDRLLELKAQGQLETGSSDSILKAVTARLLSRQPAFRCNHCGFSGRTHHWQCPSCKNWATTKTIHGVLGE
ncbi:MAG: lipopolysaccharide assembly protein LapB [Xanthomonadales bacterium]